MQFWPWSELEIWQDEVAILSYSYRRMIIAAVSSI
jgi:hypothetical protein